MSAGTRIVNKEIPSTWRILLLLILLGEERRCGRVKRDLPSRLLQAGPSLLSAPEIASDSERCSRGEFLAKISFALTVQEDNSENEGMLASYRKEAVVQVVGTALCFRRVQSGDT